MSTIRSMNIRLLLLAVLTALAAGCVEDDDGDGTTGSSGSGLAAQCRAACPAVDAADCPNGPPSVTACQTTCDDFAAGACAQQLSAYLSCAGLNPTFICAADGTVTSPGCETQAAGMNACLSTGTTTDTDGSGTTTETRRTGEGE